MEAARLELRGGARHIARARYDAQHLPVGIAARRVLFGLVLETVAPGLGSSGSPCRTSDRALEGACRLDLPAAWPDGFQHASHHHAADRLADGESPSVVRPRTGG